MSYPIKKGMVRVEIHIPKRQAKDIETYVCKKDESRKEAIERIVSKATETAKHRKSSFIYV